MFPSGVFERPSFQRGVMVSSLQSGHVRLGRNGLATEGHADVDVDDTEVDGRDHDVGQGAQGAMPRASAVPFTSTRRRSPSCSFRLMLRGNLYFSGQFLGLDEVVDGGLRLCGAADHGGVGQHLVLGEVDGEVGDGQAALDAVAGSIRAISSAEPVALPFSILMPPLRAMEMLVTGRLKLLVVPATSGGVAQGVMQRRTARRTPGRHQRRPGTNQLAGCWSGWSGPEPRKRSLPQRQR
jgi:hypothetical protein